MTDATVRILARLRALIDVIAEEAQSNPSFAGKIEASLTGLQDMAGPDAASVDVHDPSPAAGRHKDHGPHTMLHNIMFDPLECQIEAALLDGREQEARAFLGRLDRGQLEAVVKAQRLPGAKSLRKQIHEADAASAVDAIVGSAAGRVRCRYSAAG